MHEAQALSHETVRAKIREQLESDGSDGTLDDAAKAICGQEVTRYRYLQATPRRGAGGIMDEAHLRELPVSWDEVLEYCGLPGTYAEHFQVDAARRAWPQLNIRVWKPYYGTRNALFAEERLRFPDAVAIRDVPSRWNTLYLTYDGGGGAPTSGERPDVDLFHFQEHYDVIVSAIEGRQLNVRSLSQLKHQYAASTTHQGVPRRVTFSQGTKESDGRGSAAYCCAVVRNAARRKSTKNVSGSTKERCRSKKRGVPTTQARIDDDAKKKPRLVVGISSSRARSMIQGVQEQQGQQGGAEPQEQTLSRNAKRRLLLGE